MRHAMTASMVAVRCKRHAERNAASSTLQPNLSTRNRSSIRQRWRAALGMLRALRLAIVTDLAAAFAVSRGAVYRSK